MAPRKKQGPHKRGTAGRRNKRGSAEPVLSKAQLDFLEAVKQTGGRIKQSAELAGITIWAHYSSWMHKDYYRKAFDAAIDEAKKIRAHRVADAIKEAWEDGWQDEVIEQKLEPRLNADGSTTMVPVEMKRRASKKRFLAALLYEANGIFGNPARLEVTGLGGGPIQHQTIPLDAWLGVLNGKEEDAGT